MDDGHSTDSLLGQLQRGRGAGFLRALQENVAVVRPLLLDCVTHDPRWDRQVEARSEYYAALILRVGLPHDLFDAHLRALQNADQSDENDLILDTVCVLARRGHMPAVAILHDYLAYGANWGIAFEALAESLSGFLTIDEMSHVIDRRFPDEQALVRALPGVGPGMHTRREPWRSLRHYNPRVDRLLSAQEAKVERQREQEARLQAELADLHTPELLAHDQPSDYRYAAMALERHVTANDLDLLLHAAQHGNSYQRYMALMGLKHLAHPAALPVLSAYFQADPSTPSLVYTAAVRAMLALPPDLTLGIARSWFDSLGSATLHVAQRLLAEHATREDVGRCRTALQAVLQEEAADERDYYLMCDMLKVLQRFPEEGPYGEAETAFKEATYSRARLYAARVLVSSDRDSFSRSTAVECLWDCEDEIREIACVSVNTEFAAVYTRLQALSGDRFETDAIRKVAGRRLAEGRSCRSDG